MSTPQHDLAYWINERYAIKQRRAAGMRPPWTADPIMACVRWCNVHREDDAVTKWMRENWKMEGNPVWFWVLGRMLNYIPTLETLTMAWLTSDWGGTHGGLKNLSRILKEIRDEGHKVFTSAYTISTCGKRMDKIDYVVDWVVQACMEAGEPDFSSLASAFENLTNIDGLGSFLTAQVLADLKNTVGHPLQAAPDWWTWAAPGPGSLRGLNWYFNGAPAGDITARLFTQRIEECYAEVSPLKHIDVPRISMQDFQNVMCEYSKYMNVKVNNGHIRNRYVAR